MYELHGGFGIAGYPYDDQPALHFLCSGIFYPLNTTLIARWRKFEYEAATIAE
ncbi:MAG: hypothetical protein L0Y50_11765 [Beijerinckiaceae bacterium]|nr:hypothetical protein [Beijerinckiaceae bacterium]